MHVTISNSFLIILMNLIEDIVIVEGGFYRVSLEMFLSMFSYFCR